MTSGDLLARIRARDRMWDQAHVVRIRTGAHQSLDDVVEWLSEQDLVIGSVISDHGTIHIAWKAHQTMEITFHADLADKALLFKLTFGGES